MASVKEGRKKKFHKHVDGLSVITWQLRVRDLEAALAVERSGQQEAQCSLELLRAQFREVERAYSLERERSGSTERALER